MKNHRCDCWKHKHQVCDICQGITGNEKDNPEKDREPLTFKRFHKVNVARSGIDVKHSVNWSAMEWGCALGEKWGNCKIFSRK